MWLQMAPLPATFMILMVTFAVWNLPDSHTWGNI